MNLDIFEQASVFENQPDLFYTNGFYGRFAIRAARLPGDRPPLRPARRPHAGLSPGNLSQPGAWIV